MYLVPRPPGLFLFASIAFVTTLHLKGAAAKPIEPQTPPAQGVAAQPVATEEEVRTRCSACHKLPPPDILPRSAWRDEMVRMMLIQEGVPEPAGATSFLPLSPDFLRLWRY